MAILKSLFPRIARFSLLTGCVLLCAATVFAQLRLCERCGVEALAAEADCRDCGARLPAVANAPDAAADADAPDALQHVSTLSPALEELLRVAAEDVRTARAGEQTHPAVAYHYYRHAIGLVRAIPPDELSPAARDGLLAGFARCRQAISRADRACAHCNGTGRRALPVKPNERKGSLAPTITPTSVECERCRGRGKTISARTMEELRVVIGQGRAAFEKQMHALGRAGCGRGFLPAGLEEKLSLNERALIRGGLADGCKACLGLAKTDCTTCKGLGTLPCKNRGCVNGTVAGVGDAKDSPCVNCHGKGEVSCVPCQGNGAVGCKTCKGTGQADRCKTCGGEGVAQCAACRGKNTECKTCGNARQTLCAQCFGEGVKGR